MAKKSPTSDTPRRGRVRSPGEIMAQDADAAYRRFGYDKSAVVSRWKEIVGERYAKVSVPESIRFPTGRKSGGVLTLLVDGAHAPLLQHIAPMVMERVNRFFGYEAVNRIVFRQGRLPAEAPRPKRPEQRPVPRELGEGLREIADPELRACLESLAVRLASADGPPAIDNLETTSIPIVRSE